MNNKKAYICPICGYDRLPEPPRDEHGCPTYVICPCCGFEFGFDDDSEGHTYSTYRQHWIDRGFPFFNAKKRPANWNIRTMKRQLENTIAAPPAPARPANLPVPSSRT